eukprot:scaffold2.g7121.t1
MRRSIYCLIVASNVQSSRRLSEAALSGCVPVFIGPPFHTIPLVQDIDYRFFAIFINVTGTGEWIDPHAARWQHNHMISRVWKLDDKAAELSFVNVATLQEAVQYLRSLPVPSILKCQAALMRDRLKFFYPPVPPGTAYAQLGPPRWVAAAASTRPPMRPMRASAAAEAAAGQAAMAQAAMGQQQQQPVQGGGGAVAGIQQQPAAQQTQAPVVQAGTAGTAQEIVTSEAYTRSTSRDSSFVRVRFGGEPFPGVVRYYVQVVKAAEQPLSLRLAVCRFFAPDPARPHVCDPDLGVCLRALEGV